MAMKIQVHAFSIEDAEKYGINEAILLHSIKFWVETNKANKRNEKHGANWVYNSISAWNKLFPYMSPKQIRRALERLVELGVIVKANHSSNKFDRACWYTLLDECICLEGQIHLPSGANVHLPSGANEYTYINQLEHTNIGDAKNEFLLHPPPFPKLENQTTTDPLTPYLNTKNNDSYIAPAPPKTSPQKSYKQWSEKQLAEEITSHLEAGEIQGLTKEVCRAFYDYWREPAASGRHRFNLEKTWSTSLRLQRWVRTNFDKKFTGQPQNEKETESNRKVLK